MPERPTGTVTFLFTDIEGSTRLWEQHPEAMHLALARDEIRRLLATTRLLTLAGASGCGKTRLALQVAADSPSRPTRRELFGRGRLEPGGRQLELLFGDPKRVTRRQLGVAGRKSGCELRLRHVKETHLDTSAERLAARTEVVTLPSTPKPPIEDHIDAESQRSRRDLPLDHLHRRTKPIQLGLIPVLAEKLRNP